ncbi:hypothetical protein RJ640_029329 [Escallonia rubra]|uniref:Uncharacterized protein n=1 Tax=Escallonia rubra TaxID=112253 RepID=A0AA88RAS9_9ASTE|nr:hypothetical protein RJ640_029329 [Escallonia rubra]
MIGGGHHHDDMDDLIPAAQAIIPLHLGEDITRGQFHLEIDIAGIERGHTRGHLMAQGAGARSGVGALIRGDRVHAVSYEDPSLLGDMYTLIPRKQGFVKEKGANITCDDQSRIAWARQQRSMETHRRSMYSRVLCCFTTSTHLLHSSAHEHPAPAAAADGALIRLLIPLLHFDDGEQHTPPPITDLLYIRASGYTLMYSRPAPSSSKAEKGNGRPT